MILSIVRPVCAAAWDGECVDVSGDVATIRGIQCLIGNILSFTPKVIALIAVGMLIWGGIQIMNASGDAKAMAAGWQTITWAIIGIVLLSAGWLGIVLVEQFTGANITQFGFLN